MPEISVIVPVYKAEKYIRRCVDSILAQTFTDFEVILVDDGSPDNSGKICDEYAEIDSRVRVIHQKNGGVSSARNAGLDAAVGNWITFVDSDDWIDDCFMYEAIHIAESHNADIFMAGMCRYDGKKICSTHAIPCFFCVESNNLDEKQLIMLLEKCYVSSCCGSLYRKSIIKNTRFPLNVDFGEDLQFVFLLLSKNANIAFSPKVMYYYCFDDSKTENLSQSVSFQRCNSAVETYRFLFSYSNYRIKDDTFKEFLCRRWAMDLCAIERGILRSKLSLREKYARLSLLLSDKALNAYATDQEEKYLKRYATRPKLLLLYYLFKYKKLLTR